MAISEAVEVTTNHFDLLLIMCLSLSLSIKFIINKLCLFGAAGAILEKDPDSPGSLGMAISEAVEVGIYQGCLCFFSGVGYS
jgi:hypothetical protein